MAIGIDSVDKCQNTSWNTVVRPISQLLFGTSHGTPRRAMLCHGIFSLHETNRNCIVLGWKKRETKNRGHFKWSSAPKCKHIYLNISLVMKHWELVCISGIRFGQCLLPHIAMNAQAHATATNSWTARESNRIAHSVSHFNLRIGTSQMIYQNLWVSTQMFHNARSITSFTSIAYHDYYINRKLVLTCAWEKYRCLNLKRKMIGFILPYNCIIQSNNIRISYLFTKMKKNYCINVWTYQLN